MCVLQLQCLFGEQPRELKVPDVLKFANLQRFGCGQAAEQLAKTSSIDPVSIYDTYVLPANWQKIVLSLKLLFM